MKIEFGPYTAPAGGWGSVRSLATRHARRQSGKCRSDADVSEQGARFRLSELCLGQAGAAAPLRVLREWRQGDHLGADAEPCHAGILREHACVIWKRGTTMPWRPPAA